MTRSKVFIILVSLGLAFKGCSSGDLEMPKVAAEIKPVEALVKPETIEVLPKSTTAVEPKLPEPAEAQSVNPDLKPRQKPGQKKVITESERIKNNATSWGEKGDRLYDAGNLKSARSAYVNSRDLFNSINYPQSANQTQWAIDKIDSELAPQQTVSRANSDGCGFWCSLFEDGDQSVEEGLTSEPKSDSRLAENAKDNALAWGSKADRYYDSGRLRQARSAYVNSREAFARAGYPQSASQTQWAIDKIDSELVMQAEADAVRRQRELAVQERAIAQSNQLAEQERAAADRRSRRRETSVVSPAPVDRNFPPSGYVEGNCPDLLALGLSDFTPGDANYSSRRDRDKDGVACESP